MNIKDFSLEEKVIKEAIINARRVQDYIWAEESFFLEDLDINALDIDKMIKVFQKRVDKLKEIDKLNSHYKVELRKRLLQQAALSIAYLQMLDTL